ncbi:8-amino-7-oxononanoate synthase [Alginatibacterium sediminis]|uniref:8-amino-7-oxononanoate synthase n=1 Tax=Alginatibacterium sediminis TaxID=2164068 RepID=A0A420EI63_9ALTE|nr:8-amino-7-oxononanoate synthase [Alginatibacterium sediminis]RKF20421.1 8-amino-7-oxononanoate synthase [Alginatibacterium sediminis]
MNGLDQQSNNPRFAFVAQQLQQRQQQFSLRQRQTIEQIGDFGSCQIAIDGKSYINFASNDYLGLSKHPKVLEAWQASAIKYGCGSGGSALVSGYQAPHYQLEQTICEWLKVPAVLLYNCGFSANQAFIKAMMHKDALLLQDKLNHASLMEAGILSAAKMQRFAHNDMKALELRLNKQNQDTLVVSEGVFSMDGDLAPLAEINRLCQQSQAMLLVDDAHGIGVLGPQGQGSVAHAGIGYSDQIAQMLTFGKALGVNGACIAASEQLIDYLVNFSKAYVYSTTMPAAQAAAIDASIELVQQQPQLRQTLNRNIELFRALCCDFKIEVQNSSTAIQPLILGSSQLALDASHYLKTQGHWVVAIRPPTVALNSARLRITLSASHSKVQIEALVRDLAKFLDQKRASFAGEDHAG